LAVVISDILIGTEVRGMIGVTDTTGVTDMIGGKGMVEVGGYIFTGTEKKIIEEIRNRM
jgi:hypothetical protein